MRTGSAVVAFVLLAGAVVAQPTPNPPPPAPLPAGQVVSMPIATGAEPAGLPGGKEVSQPLQPVGFDPVETNAPDLLKPAGDTFAPEVKTIPPENPRGPLGPAWDDLELLYWWPLRQPVPALAYGTRTGLAPEPGQDGTQQLVGGRALGSQPSAGGRFTLGMAINDAETVGVEAVYFFLGTRSFNQSARDFSGGTTSYFGVPYIDSATGTTSILPLAQPGVSHAYLDVSTSVRAQGWEVNTVANVLDEKYVKLNAIIGWRYFEADEGLHIAQTQFNIADGSVIRTGDQFDAHNRFNGGQLGLHADLSRGVVFCELTAKIAFGQNYEVVKDSGETIFQQDGLYGPVTKAYPGSGIYVQPSNAGQSSKGVFAFLPEGTFKFGFRLGEAARIYAGYSFLYLSDAVRPGDQIDRSFHPDEIPLVSGTGPVYGGDRPVRFFNHADFWVQGLIIGLETRY
jgi:hypothetical protein